MIRAVIGIFLLSGCLLAQEPTEKTLPAKPSRIRVSEGVAAGLVTKKVMPEYPASALAVGHDGIVVVTVVIGTDGKISSAEATAGDEALREASVAAAKQFEFRPFAIQQDGTRTVLVVETRLAFEFTYEGEGEQRKGRVEFLTKIPPDRITSL